MVGSTCEATLDDFDEIFKLLEQLWPDKALSKEVLKQVFSSAIKAPYNIYLCTEVNGRIAGFCSLVITESLMVDGLAGHINELVIDESFRGTGIGTELLEAVIVVAKSRGCKRIGLNSAFFRKEAHEFYLNRGLIKSAYFFSKEL